MGDDKLSSLLHDRGVSEPDNKADGVGRFQAASTLGIYRSTFIAEHVCKHAAAEDSAVNIGKTWLHFGDINTILIPRCDMLIWVPNYFAHSGNLDPGHSK